MARPDGIIGSIAVILIILFLAASGCLESSSQGNTLNVSTEKTVYHSNESLNVHVSFNSTKEVQARLEISGIKNLFGRPMLTEARDVVLKKGDNGFDLKFKTPSCEECSAVAPGKHYINATISAGKEKFDGYVEIILEREGANASSGAGNVSSGAVQTAHVVTNKSSAAVIVEYFYDPACQKCAKAAPVIDNVINSYGSNVSFSKYNILTDGGLALATKYQIPGVPSIVINERELISYADYEGNTTKLEEILREAVEKASFSTGVREKQKIVLSVPSVFVVGLLAGFNPCLLAILAFIASVTLASTGRRRNVLLIVLMFSLGIFATYLVVGIGLLNVIEQMPSLQASIRNALVLLIAVLGLWHVYDAWHLRSNAESSFHTPKSFIRLTESVTKNVSLPASFFIGALFSLIKAPCVGAVYFVILDMVRSGSSEGLLYLASYNLGVVMPVLILGFAIAFGLNPEKVEKFRKDRRVAMRLVTGLTLLAIAVLMYAGII